MLRGRDRLSLPFFFLGRGHPPPASKMAVQYMKEFKMLVKEVPCSEGIVLPHVLVSNFVVGLKFRQVDFFFEPLIQTLVGPQ